MTSRTVARLTLVAGLAAAVTVTNASDAEADGEHCFSSRSSNAFDTGRLGVGGAVGHEWQVDERDGDQVSLLGHVRLTPRITAELEIGRTEYHDSSEGVDKRVGGALAYQVGKLAFLSPYILAGGGVYGRAKAKYLEAGAGVKFPISRNFVLMLDVRTGHRYATDPNPDDVIFAQGQPGARAPDTNEFDYSRWRLMGMVFF